MLMPMLMGMSPGHGATLQNATYTNSNGSPTNSSAYIQVNDDGAVHKNSATGASGGVDVTAYTWMTGTGPASAYEVRATETSGVVDAPSSAVGTWLAISGADPVWFKTRTSDVGGTDTCTITVEIRDAATLVVLASASVTLNAEVIV